MQRIINTVPKLIVGQEWQCRNQAYVGIITEIHNVDHSAGAVTIYREWCGDILPENGTLITRLTSRWCKQMGSIHLHTTKFNYDYRFSSTNRAHKYDLVNLLSNPVRQRANEAENNNEPPF